MNNKFLIYTALLLSQICFSQNLGKVIGRITDFNERPISSVIIELNGRKHMDIVKPDGSFVIEEVKPGKIHIRILKENYKTYHRNFEIKEGEIKRINPILYQKNEIEAVDIYRKNPIPALETLTRLPIKSQEAIQAISIISEEVIRDQGALSLTNVVQNVPGVTLFGSYGGVRESMSMRGYRGTPVLKNGVQLDSDFRTASVLTDMQGVESVQVLRGSAALTQGIGDGLGSPGGVINIVTKTPNFLDKTTVGFRTGSWGQVRPTLDFQKVLDADRSIAMRFNAAYERGDSYRAKVKKDRIYFNPSFEIRPDSKTRILLEMDYFKANTTPDHGTVNLNEGNIYALYEMPYDKFLGFSSDNISNETVTYGARVFRKISEKLNLRGSYFSSSYNVDSQAASLSSAEVYNKKYRGLSKSKREDENSVFQLDLVGKEIEIGKLKNTFQIGADYRTTEVKSTSFNSFKNIDIVDVLDSKINNNLHGNYVFVANKVDHNYNYAYGLMAQNIIEFNKYLRVMLGVRYNSQIGKTSSTADVIKNQAWDPFFGMMVFPVKNINVFGSYTTTSSLRSANNKDKNGNSLGTSVSKQFEFGFKSSWFSDSLLFNVTYFDIENNDLQHGITIPPSTAIAYYILAGDLKRNGVEVELVGKITQNLKVILGYAYLNARYRNSPSYVEGSRPMNAPKNTANAWVQYKFEKGMLKNLSLSAGIYYVGDRPVNEWSETPDGHGTKPGLEPFMMPAYTTVNAQVGYGFRKIQAKVFINNIFDALGYNSYYRGGYINQIDPRNLGAEISYSF